MSTDAMQSDSIKELATALSLAQATNDRHAEAELLPAFRAPRRGVNASSAGPDDVRFFSKVSFASSGCWVWTGGRCHLGYGMFANHGEVKAHRASWRLFRGEIPDGLFVLHSCDVRSCVNPDHLFLGTQTDNMRDMAAKGRGRHGDLNGEANPMAVLTADAVRRMRAERAANGTSYRRLGEMFGVRTMTAYRATTGQAWRST